MRKSLIKIGAIITCTVLLGSSLSIIGIVRGETQPLTSYSSQGKSISLDYHPQLRPTLNRENNRTKNQSSSDTKKNTMVTTYQFDEPKILQEKGYSLVEMKGLAPTDSPGEPILPCKPVTLLLPQQCTVASIDVEGLDEIRIGEGYTLKVGEEPTSTDNQLTVSQNTIKTNNPLDTISVFPTEPFVHIGTYTQRGYTYVLVNLLPVRYFPKTGEISYYKEMKLTITLTYTDEVNNFYRGLTKDREFTQQVSPETSCNINSYTDLPSRLKTVMTLTDSQESYDYVIITREALRTSFQPFIDYKNGLGIRTTLVTVEDIQNTPAYWVNGTWGDGTLYGQHDNMFNDTAAQIRNFIRDAYANWGIDYVLLGGDAPDTVPARTFYLGYYSEWNEECFGPSDNYYSCLDGTFNYDLDGYWAEPTDGVHGADVDLLAEVFIGRACVDTSQDVANFILKTCGYADSSAPYLNNVLLTSTAPWGDGYFMNQFVDECTQDDVITHGIPSTEYTISTLYENNYPWYVIQQQIINQINNGVHIINHLGHSSSLGNIISISDVSALSNSDYCFIYSQGCNAGNFLVDNCIAEYFTVKTPHAAFAGIWNTNYGWAGPSNYFQRWFWDAIFNESTTRPFLRELGPANQQSKERNLYHLNERDFYIRFLFYELELFGDPQLSIKRITSPPTHDTCMYHLGIENNSHVEANEIVPVETRVGNLGQQDENNIHVSIFIDDVFISSQIVEVLPSQAIVPVIFDCNFSPGEHTIRVMVAPSEGDENTANNMMSVTIIAGPDITVSSVIVPSYIYVDSNNIIVANVTNLVSQELHEITVRLRINDQTVASIVIPVLLSHQTETVTFEWIPETFQQLYSFVVVADPVNDEGYTMNNRCDGGTARSIRHTLYVDDDGTADFIRISDAVNAAGPYDTVYVHSGVYHNAIYISRPLTLVGENKSTTMISIDFGWIIHIISENVSIHGFSFLVTGGCFVQLTCSDIIIDASHVTISDCNILNNYYGLRIAHGSFNVISNNTISGGCIGIQVENGERNNLTKNQISISGDNADSAITLMSDNNLIFDSDISSNAESGIYGINIESSENFIVRNFIHDLPLEGIVIYGNENNILTQNRISNCGDCGIYLCQSSNNHLYHNDIIDNGCNAYDDGGVNSWDNGFPSGGNYWGDYTGEDMDNDGIGDEPYYIPDVSIDNYPMMSPMTSFIPALIANANGPYFSCCNELIQFTGTKSGGVLPFTYQWSFGDGQSSLLQNPIHSYIAPGVYPVVLTVTDSRGVSNTNIATATVNIPGNSPVGWWRFNEGQGSTIHDISGNHIDGTISGASWDGAAGYGLQFDGVNDYVNLGSSPLLRFGTGDCSIAIWVKTTTATNQGRPYDIILTNQNNYSLVLYQERIGFNLAGNTILGNTDVYDQQWHYLVYTRQGTHNRLYVDGACQRSCELSIENYTSSYNTYIGMANYHTDYFKGILRDLQLYRRVLSAGEVQALYQNSLQIVSNAHGPYSGFVNEPIHFVGTAIGGIPPYSFNWNFGDGTHLIGQQVNHIYTNTGVYPITLTVIDNQGNSINNITTASVLTRPLIANAHGPYYGFINEQVEFTGSASGGVQPYSWLWDFCDGTTSTLQNPIHAFTRDGTSTIILTVTDSQNNIQITSTSTTIFSGYQQTIFYYHDIALGEYGFSAQAEAAIRITPDELQACEDGYLIGARFYNSPYNPSAWSGVLKIYDQGTPIAPGALLTSVPFIASTGGWIRIILPIRIALNTNQDLWVSIQIPEMIYIDVDMGPAVSGKGDWFKYGSTWYELPEFVDNVNWNIEALIAIEPQELLPDAQGPSEGVVNEQIQFTGSVSGGVQPYLWNWEFGDGTTSTEQNPVHQYSDDGTFQITLNVTDSRGSYSIAELSIFIVNTPPQAEFSFTPDQPIENEPVSFIDTSIDHDGTIISWLWGFGDGSNSNEQYPIHLYTTQGIYTVMLTVTDNDGAIDTVSQTVEVLHQNQPPNIPTIPSGTQSGFIDKSYDFSTLATDPENDQIYYQWNWGDGTISSWDGPYDSDVEIHNAHIWGQEGIYQISVKVKDIHDAESDWSSPLTIIISREDVAPPTIDHVPITQTVLGEDFVVHAIIVDDVTPIPMAYVDYRAINTAVGPGNQVTKPWTTITMNYNEQDQQYKGTISSAEIAKIYSENPKNPCFEYRIWAVDKAGHLGSTKYITVNIIDPDSSIQP